MLFSKLHNAYFANIDHLDFFSKQSARLNPDCYLRSLIYALGICSETRRRFGSIYNVKDRCIVPGAIKSEWQTGSSLKVTRLAFQLYTNGTPSAYLCQDVPDVSECERYSVADIFCCSYAPLFVEAIKLRYPEYMQHVIRNA